MNAKLTDYIIATILILFAAATIALLPLMATGHIDQTTGIQIFQSIFLLIAILVVLLLVLSKPKQYY